MIVIILLQLVYNLIVFIVTIIPRHLRLYWIWGQSFKVIKKILWETLDSEIHVIRAQHTRGDIVCVFGLHNT